MSTVTREEFDSFKNEILKQLATLNNNIAELVTELKVNNANTCKDIKAICEKIDSLQDSRSEMWKLLHDLKIKVYIAYAIPPILFGAYQIFKMLKP